MDTHRILVVCTTDSMIWNFLVPHIKNLENNGYTVECACSVTGDFFENLQKIHNLTMHRIGFRRSPYSFKNIKALSQLKKIVRERKIDTIFCHEPVGGAIGRIVGHQTKCKVIYMAHGFHFYKGAPRKSKIYYWVEKYLARYTDDLITINQEDYEASLKFKAKRKHLLPGIGIDTTKFLYSPDAMYLRKELSISEQDLILLSIGELIKRKNHETVINAMVRINNPHLHYVIVGDGELEDYLKSRIQELGLNNVHLLGYRRDINKICNSSDVFIMPSYQEGLSVALMEAMACGLPVIASSIRGNVDLIPSREYGILVAPDDVNGYGEAIEYFSNDRNQRVETGRRNIERVKIFDIKNVEGKLFSIISR